MATDIEVHPIQANILMVLLFKPEARFAELNKLKMSNDHFSFHLKRLLELGLVEKRSDSGYALTPKGKEFSSRFDTERIVVERQAKLGVLIVGSRRNSQGEVEYLIQQRLKEPFYGFYGFMTGKIRWGETVAETAAREFKEETGLTGKLELVGVKHKMDYSKKGELLEDKFFYVFRATTTKGKLAEKFEGGRNLWLTEKEIFKLPDLFDGVKESIDMANFPKLTFVETKYQVKKY